MSASPTTEEAAPPAPSPDYKWIALINTTVGMLLVTINSSILLIALPDIFRGIGIDPLEPQNTNYLLWMILGFLVVTAVLVVSLGRAGDVFGRVRTYNLGFAVFTLFSILLFVTPLDGSGGALWIIGMRIGQGVGGAMLFANSSAILTDAFPENQRGLALGINGVAAIAGSFLGLVIGGLLAEWDWRAVFWVSVPIAIAGTVWGYQSLHELGTRRTSRMDWWGNGTFAVGLTALLVAITYGIQPYGDHATGWTNPWVVAGLVGGVALLVAFVIVENRVSDPMFSMQLFKIRPFAMGNLASVLAATSRGGMQFMLIIWLQGIWLPLHGYAYESTPLWAGIYLLPLTIGFLVAGPIAGKLSDRYGARLFATLGLVLVAVSFVGFLLIPVDFTYTEFALLLLLNGLASGLFAAPNATMIMNSVPANQRGAASGMRGTFMNSGSALSIGIFFSLMVAGLASSLPHSLRSGLTGQGVPSDVAGQVADLPPVGSLFASFLGYNPIQTLLEPSGTLDRLPAGHAATLTGKEFFPHLISQPFHDGLVVVFLAAALMSLVAAGASVFSGGLYVHQDEDD